MENIKAQIAFDLMPLMAHLYDGGIIGIYPTFGKGGQIQMTVEAFCETFPGTEPNENPNNKDYPWRWSAMVKGVEFFALAETPERK